MRIPLPQKSKYIKKCKGLKFLWNIFNCVTSLEECEFSKEVYQQRIDIPSFFSRARYIMKNTCQVTAETWYNYLQIHDK